MEQVRLSPEVIRENVNIINDRIAAAAARSGRSRADITLLAATKTRTAEEVAAAVAAGIDAAGENRVQELTAKLAEHAYEPLIPHFIGALQTNKVKYVVGNVALIHSVGSAHLAEAISAASVRRGVTTSVLCELNLGGEESKSGAPKQEAEALCAAIAAMPGLCLRGLMTVPPPDPDEARRCFAALRELLEAFAPNLPAGFDRLSMGMTHDFEAAIAEGATIVRIGTGIFGERLYLK